MNLRLILGLALSLSVTVIATAQYAVDKLVSDLPGAAHLDPDLVNPWGIAFGPTDIWVADNGTAKSSFYDADGVSTGVTKIPGPGGNPTGTVYNGNGGFKVNGFSSQFLFDSEDGTISGWYPQFAGSAFVAVDNGSLGAIYKGLAISGSTLYTADFGRGEVEMYDDTFKSIGTFTDPNLESGYTPFNVQTLGDKVYVSFAFRDGNSGDEVDGAGLGLVDVFSTAGVFEKRLISHGALNAPWGMAMAPSNFGEFGGDLLVGNFGNARINAFDPVTGAFLGSLKDTNGNDIVLDGLWGLEFGTGTVGATDSLYFTAGLNGEVNGLFGTVRAVPEPASLAVLAIGALLFKRRKR